MLNTIYDLFLVVKVISLFPVPSKGQQYTPDLKTFNDYLQHKKNTNDTQIKQHVAYIAKCLHNSLERKGKYRKGKDKEPPRCLKDLIAQCLTQNNLGQKTALLPGVVLALLPFKQISSFWIKPGKNVFDIG